MRVDDMGGPTSALESGGDAFAGLARGSGPGGGLGDGDWSSFPRGPGADAMGFDGQARIRWFSRPLFIGRLLILGLYVIFLLLLFLIRNARRSGSRA